MKTPTELILVVSFFITLIMTSVTYLTWRRERKNELLHQLGLWSSLAINVVIYYGTRNESPLLIGASMVGWILPIRYLSDVVKDLSGESLFERWGYIALLAGGFLSLALGGYQHDFRFFTAPFSLTLGGLGLYGLFQAFHKTPHVKRTAFFSGSFLFMGFLFLEKLLFPVLRLTEASEILSALLLLSIAGLSSLLLSGVFENFTIAQVIETEELMKDRNEKLLGQSKFSELGMMSAGIAHEINNPLAVIQARTTQLLRIYRNPDRQKDLADGLQQILYTSERINRTIQGVREFVHQDEQGPFTQIDLKNLFDDVLAFCGQRMKNHGVNLRFYGLEKFTVVGNKIQLEQIILNLLNNAFDAIEYLPDKWIEVSAHPNQGHIRLYFKDSGHGIPKEIATRIMDPFFSTKDLGKGTGLGLALARGIAEKHGGSLQYLDDCPHTTFLLELPENASQEWGNSLH